MSIEEPLGAAPATEPAAPAAGKRPETLEAALGSGGDALAEQIQASIAPGQDARQASDGVAALALEELGASSTQPSTMRDLLLLADINLEVSVEFGRARLPLKQLLSLTDGAVIPLERSVDEPVDILVNGTPVGKGEVVVVGDDFGVRVTEIRPIQDVPHGAPTMLPAPLAPADPVVPADGEI